MSVLIVVENGSGLTNSTSYASVDEYRAYWLNKGVDHSSLSDDQVAIRLNDGSEYADYFYCYGGYRESSEQALNVPRTGWYDTVTGEDLSESVPVKLKETVYELSDAREGGADETTTITSGVKSKKAGPVSVTYTDEAANGDIKTTYTTANRKVKGLLLQTTNSGLCLPK